MPSFQFHSSSLLHLHVFEKVIIYFQVMLLFRNIISSSLSVCCHYHLVQSFSFLKLFPFLDSDCLLVILLILAVDSMYLEKYSCSSSRFFRSLRREVSSLLVFFS